MENEREGIEQTLFRLLDYRAEHNVDNDSLLIMLSLLNLMGLVNALNRDGTGASSAGGGNLQSLLPLLAIAAAGLGGGTAGGPGGQFNPAALLGLLSGVLGGGQKELTGILNLLGPLMGPGAPAQAAPEGQPGEKNGPAPVPVQREINLDRKNQTEIKSVKNPQQERLSGESRVLEWKFGGGAR